MTAGKEESVFLEEIEHFGDIASEVSFQDWETILEIRDLVNQTIEAERTQGNIKGSLDTEIDLVICLLYTSPSPRD